MDGALAHRVELATQAIVELINSKPRSPRPDEISTIIAAFVLEQASAAPICLCKRLDEEYGPATATK